MHEWSSSIDTSQLLAAMASGDTSSVQQIHDKADSLVKQLQQQLEAVTEPIAVSWLKASAYDTYALLIRTADWLCNLRDFHAAQELSDLVKVRVRVHLLSSFFTSIFCFWGEGWGGC
jgi:hypothetical protein